MGVVSLWLVLGDLVSFLFMALKAPPPPPQVLIPWRKLHIFLGEQVDHRELNTCISVMLSDTLTCCGALPSSQLSCLTSTPCTGQSRLVPQAGTDKCSPEVSMRLICVGHSGPVPLPHAAATELDGETRELATWPQQKSELKFLLLTTC